MKNKIIFNMIIEMVLRLQIQNTALINGLQYAYPKSDKILEINAFYFNFDLFELLYFNLIY